MGIKKRKNLNITKEKIREYKESGLTFVQMGKLFGCTGNTVKEYSKAFGLHTTKPVAIHHVKETPEAIDPGNRACLEKAEVRIQEAVRKQAESDERMEYLEMHRKRRMIREFIRKQRPRIIPAAEIPRGFIH